MYQGTFISAQSRTKEYEFILPARPIFGKAGASGNLIENRRFRAFLGITECVCVTLWDTIGRNRPMGRRQEHFLRASMFFKTYNAEQVNNRMCSVDKKRSGNGAGSLFFSHLI